MFGTLLTKSKAKTEDAEAVSGFLKGIVMSTKRTINPKFAAVCAWIPFLHVDK